MFNLVIKMDQGKIYEMVWDNGCFDCDKKNCVKDIFSSSVFDSSINQTYSNCKVDINGKENGKDVIEINNNQNNNNKNGNDTTQIDNEELSENKPEPKFYITWFGTDKNKRQLKTAGLAMTKFKPYISSGSFYSSINGLFS